ncbi:hypothetical protein [Oceanobacillus senegalensis]|uniref:hypothetical protein n=1 Tax=Oceanobacillus senegalensis TaxID=1936063 RepID=UPI000A307E0A|nr:hypothetical protein [Oceanobacillus senegalensis]
MVKLNFLEKTFLITGMLHVGFISYCFFIGYDLNYYDASKYVTFALFSMYFAISIYRDITFKRNGSIDEKNNDH